MERIPQEVLHTFEQMARTIQGITSGIDPVRFAELFNHTNYAEDLPLARLVLDDKRFRQPSVLNAHGQALSIDGAYKLGYAMGVVKTCDETIDQTLRGVTLEQIKEVHRVADTRGMEPTGYFWRECFPVLKGSMEIQGHGLEEARL